MPEPTEPPVPLRLVTWNLNHWRQPLLPVDTRRAAGPTLPTPSARRFPSSRRRCRRSTCRRNGPSMASLRDTATGARRSSPSIQRSRSSPSARSGVPGAGDGSCSANTHPGSMAVARLTIAGIEPITLVSVYGVMDGSSVFTMLRIAADLVPLFDSPHGARVILGGDFNVSRAGQGPPLPRAFGGRARAIRSLGLVEAKTIVSQLPAPSPECWCGSSGSCDHVPTWGRTELDHLFLSPALASQVTALTVDPGSVEAGLSDHVPLVLDLALTAERTPHPWDEESFAEEIGRRHGPAARDVVEKLVSWADQKERELAKATGVATKALTRFPTNGVTTEPELMFPVDLNLLSRAAASPRSRSMPMGGSSSGSAACASHRSTPRPGARSFARRSTSWMVSISTGARSTAGRGSRFQRSRTPAKNLLHLVAVLDRIATESHRPGRGRGWTRRRHRA